MKKHDDKPERGAKVLTGFRHAPQSKRKLLREARKRGWSVSQLVEKITNDWIEERS